MKRRTFGLMAGTSMLALMASSKRSYADTPDPSLLQTTLTPFGAERAGNAAGTIPAWTGGLTEIPAGFDWDPEKTLPPDFFASDAMLYEVNSANLAQYADLVSDGLQTLIKTKGFYMKVYPTHRTHALQQWIYDKIAKNCVNAKAQVAGEYRLGFTNAYGGIPFPIPSTDPYAAGAQLVWNHQSRYTASFQKLTVAAYTVENGAPILVSGQTNWARFDYYQQGGTPETFDLRFYSIALRNVAPSTVSGNQALFYSSASPTVSPYISWEMLNGQGRVRKTPNVLYDSPNSYTDGITNYDEIYCFNGPMDRYDWKLVGKKEMLIPYNNNKVVSVFAADAHKPNYFDPEALRWELHRVWVVQATLHPGERDVIPNRTIYLDEDTSLIALSDNYDAAGNLVRHHHNININFPNLPATIYLNTISYSLQTGNYVSQNGSFADSPYNDPYLFGPMPPDTFLPQTMAADASY